jgi:hypothetical protein
MKKMIQCVDDDFLEELVGIYISLGNERLETPVRTVRVAIDIVTKINLVLTVVTDLREHMCFSADSGYGSS